eukprot:12398390-Karenia_brevis.AAC.1
MNFAFAGVGLVSKDESIRGPTWLPKATQVGRKTKRTTPHDFLMVWVRAHFGLFAGRKAQPDASV